LGQRVYDKACFYARRNERRRLRRLIDKRPQLRTSHNSLLLFTAVWDNPGLVPWLLERGVSADCRCGTDCYTPLMHVASEGNTAMIRLLLAFGADAMATNADGERPLGYACAWNQPDAAKLLLDAGADPNIPEDQNATYLDWATTGEHTDLVTILSSHSALTFSQLTQTGE